MAPEGFRRRPVDLGLSKVEAEDPETSDGVRIAGGANEGGVAEIRLLGIREYCATAVTGVGGFVLLLPAGSTIAVPWPVLFIILATCCAPLCCLPLLSVVGLVGIRLT